MTQFAATLCLLLLPVTAWAQDEGALGPAPAPHTDEMREAMSRAQIAQMVADRGYFEIDNLTRQSDGSWTCTALAGPGKRVALTIRTNGSIIQRDLPPDAGH